MACIHHRLRLPRRPCSRSHPLAVRVSAANKARGSRWESDLEQHLNAAGLKARRLPRAGVKDLGDVAIELDKVKVALVLEAKNVKTPDMAQFLREAEREAGHYEDKYQIASLGVVVTKTRGKGAGQGRVTMTVDDLVCLLRWSGVA